MSDTFRSQETELAGERRGWRGYVVPGVLLLLTVSFYLNVVAPPGGPPPGWGNDFEAAMAEAAESRKPIVVSFYSDG